MTGKQTHYLAMAVLIGMGLALVGATFFHRPAVSEAAASAPVTARALPTRTNDTTSYSLLCERPIFMASRRPPPPAVKAEVLAAAVPASPPAVTLLGVMIKKEQKAILVKRNSAKEVMVLREGQVLDGWTVKQVKAHEVVMSAGENQFSLAFPKPRSETPAR